MPSIAATTGHVDALSLRDRSRATRERWLVGGVATELALRLQASCGFIRVLFAIAGYLDFWAVLGIYGVLALLLPHGGRRRPDWSNLVGLLRIGTLLGVAEFSFRWVSFNNGVFDQPPAVWIPVAGTALLAWLVVLNSRRPATGVPAMADRRIVLSALVPLSMAATVAAIVILAPGIRADRLLELMLVALGLFGVLRAGRLNRGALAAACLPIGLLTVLLAGSGAPLTGGVGDLTVAPQAALSNHVYRRAVGGVRLDLYKLHPAVGARVLPWVVSVGIGRIEIDLPSDALTTVHVSIGSGTLNWGYLRLGADQDRFMLRRTIVVTPRQASGGEPFRPKFHLTINATVGQGCVALASVSSQGSC